MADETELDYERLVINQANDAYNSELPRAFGSAHLPSLRRAADVVRGWERDSALREAIARLRSYASDDTQLRLSEVVNLLGKMLQEPAPRPRAE